MLSFSKRLVQRGVELQFQGILDGSIDYDQQVGTPPAVLIIRGSLISHVNSSAIRPWLMYFKKAQEQGCKLIFQECSSAMVDFFNAAPACLCGGEVESVIGAFYCSQCRTNPRVLLDLKNTKDLSTVLEQQPCPACKKNLVFDDVPESFFAFLHSG